MASCDALTFPSNEDPSEGQIRRRERNPCPIDTSFSSWKSVRIVFYSLCTRVHEATASNGARCAVKVVALYLLDYGIEKRRSELYNEISILERIEHENIVKYLGCKKYNDVVCIFYEFVDGLPIQALYEEEILESSKIPYYTRQILKALEYLHTNNIVHRNLRCHNVLVDKNGTVRLTGFKFADKVNDATTHPPDIGLEESARWLAPEIVNSEGRQYGMAADIWSLGCTVLEMVTRNLPFPDLNWLHAVEAISNGERPSIPDSISGDVRDFIERCLHESPEDRPTASQLLKHHFVCCPSN